MQKLALLAAAASLLFTGCGTPQPSRTWATIRSVPHAGPFVKAPDATYAANLHKALQAACVDHKVVTFQFRYRSRILLTRQGEETAVIFRNSATPALPWWIMSERLWSPVWLPTQPVASQVAFYMRRPVTIVKVKDFTANATPSDGKQIVRKTSPGKKHAGSNGKSAAKSKARNSAGAPSKSKASRGRKK